MSNAFRVRCTASDGRAMAGIYAAALTAAGMVATWLPARAKRFESASDANITAKRLASRFSGTAWAVELVPEVGQ